MTVGPPMHHISHVYRVMRSDGRDLQQPTEDETKTKAQQDPPLRFRQEVVYAITFGSQPDYVSPFLHATNCMQLVARCHGARCVVKPRGLPR